MASNQTSATALIALVRQRSYQPANGGPTDTAILRDLNAELSTFVVPLLTTIGEEFFVDLHEFETVQNQESYAIPSDSIASKIRDVQVLADDNVSWISIAHEEPERAATYAQSYQRPIAYFIRSTKIVLLPKPSTGGQSLRMAYYRRPRQIVNNGYANASAVSGPSAGNYSVTVDTTDMTTGNFDILDPVTYEIISEALPGTVTNSTTLTFAASALDADQITALLAATNDTFIGSGLAPVADVPPEAAVLLAQRVAAMILQEQADPRMAQAFSEVERVKLTLQNLFAPRASGRARKVVNRNGPGWGSWRWGYRRWWS